ncbi:unnamed protein product [Phyllotreta striolata]|uniref:Uncharacterized protein n=1 Tax=Phyllotreta striolata TaxID=444603 RepID=A0A9N9XR43_PHYSR|nr:unnamed protein product [Phyllotreta striolata]
MISKKEYLLVRPWQQRKFIQHRKKVLTALPAIDNNPPPFRAHVNIKLKKQQKEKDRCRRIEHDNYLLLQRLNYVMNTSRVDNTWRSPQPNFLNRVGLYETYDPQIEELIALDLSDDSEDEKEVARCRKSKCYACAPEKNPVEPPKIPEERIPWEPERKPVHKPRSKSVPSRKPEPLPAIQEQVVTTISKPSSSKTLNRPKMVEPSKGMIHVKPDFSANEPQSIVFNRGCLELSVNFPSDTTVKFKEGKIQKFLLRGLCHCRNSPSAREK